MTDKENKARQLLENKRVKKTVETDKRTHFNVIGDTETHAVIFDKTQKKFSCDCRYFSLRQEECSHIIACRLLTSE